MWRSTGSLQIGDIGRARLQIFDEALVENASALVGVIANSVGIVEVDGEGSLWDTNGFVTIGVSGRGSLSVTGKGRVTSGDARIGDNASSLGEVLVDGVDSAWNITGVLLVSEPGEATLKVANGGLVTATGVVTVGARGQLTMAGGRLESAAAGGLVNQGLVHGSGTIHAPTVNNSTAASEIRLLTGDHLALTGTLANAGTVDLQGGELEVLGTTTSTADIDARDGAVLRFHGDGLVNNNGARLALTSGIVDVFGLVDNNAGAQIIVGGEANAVFHDALANDGQLFVQPGGELLTLENLAMGAGATLSIQLAAVDFEEEGVQLSDGFGQVQVGSGATLTGALAVELSGGYMPTAGDMFQILTAAGGITGTFNNELLPALSGGLSWDVLYDTDSVTLAVIGATLTGDYNQNGIVDAADYTVWRDMLGQNVTPGSGADGSANGTIGDEDYALWKTNFGASAEGAAAGLPSSASAPVPEPDSIRLAACMLVAVSFTLARAKRRRYGIDGGQGADVAFWSRSA